MERKTGLIGLGTIAPHYLHAIRHTPEVKLTAVCDSNPQKARQAVKLGVKYYQDYQELIERGRVDLIIVATPNKYHADQAIFALRQGKHVLCEKPMAVNLGQARSMAEAAINSGKVLFVPFHHAYNLDVQRLIAHFASQKPHLVSFLAQNTEDSLSYMNPANAWYFNPKISGGGCVIDMGINFIDLLRNLVGELEVVSVQIVTPSNLLVETEAYVEFKFASGQGSLVVKSSSPIETRKILLNTRDGSEILLNLLSRHYTYNDGVLMHQEYMLVLREFLNSVRNGKGNWENALENQKLVETIYTLHSNIAQALLQVS